QHAGSRRVPGAHSAASRACSSGREVPVSLNRPTPWLAFAVFLLASIVYLITMTPTVPFWDSGEFIAVSYILGIPHPPGTPFYVLIGRIATLVPWASVAQRVNALS